MKTITIAISLAALNLAACGHPRYRLVEPPLYRSHDMRAADKTETPTEGLMLIADSQLNQLTAPVNWLYRNQFMARHFPRVVRSIPLEIYAPEVLRWALQTWAKRGRFVVHLGDALNTGCISEFHRFVRIMDSASDGWLMAPGNHDFYYNGHRHSAEPPDGKEHMTGGWQTACAPEGPLGKNLFIRSYLAALRRQSHTNRQVDAGIRAFAQKTAASNMHKTALRGEWHSKGTDGRLRSVAWKIDRKRPWNSFVVQRIRLPTHGRNAALEAILLDTTQYAPHKSMPVTGGGFGDMGYDQARVVSRWLAAKKPTENPVVLMGHHPYAMLRLRGRAILNKLRSQSSIPLYVSAHRHRGEYIHHKYGHKYGHSSRHGAWLEMNIGSVTDWPPEFRFLEAARGATDPKTGVRGLMLWSRLVRLAPQINPYERCRAQWKQTELYRAHYAEPLLRLPTQPYAEAYAIHTRRLIHRTIRAERKSFPPHSPSNKKRLRDYKLCQAYWASKGKQATSLSDDWQRSMFFPQDGANERKELGK